ncbi:hypothetical protein BDZ94DRAFT_1321603 [Collybia nuda]|uniref:F-box domain-containing protein n=1 Tax=Collybia nuda TaxID=64659 RepID=A0A9P5Y7N0_9AGAR|nr:hypothetical protein BDZ94DRAFT_1321603 [Collybia nuda]
MMRTDSELNSIEPRLFDLPNVLGHNDWSLSDAAELEAQRLLAAAQHRLALFEAETPPNLAGNAEVRRAALTEKAQLYRTAIAPHRKLPNEILTEIFFAASDKVTVPAANIDSKPPWTLFRVCKRWREIALTTPKLWTYIRLYYQDKGEDDRWLDMSKAVLARSEGKLMTLRITGERSRGYTAGWTQLTPLAKAFREIVIPNAHRLQKFRIDASSQELIEIFNIASPEWASLRHLILSCSAKNMAPRGIVKVFENAPHLRTLKSYLKMFSGSGYHFPWAHITKLDMPYSKLHPYAALEILRKCPNIETCILSFSDNMFDSSHKYIPSTNTPREDQSPVTLPALKLLDVDIYKCSSFILFLGPLVLPQLTTLSIDGETVMVPDPWNPEYIPIIARFERLEKISLNISVPSIDIDALIKQITPLLTEFSIPRGDVLSISTLSSITSGELLPNLKELHCKITDDTLRAHLDMVERRKAIKANFRWAHSEATFRKEGGEYGVRFKALEESGRLSCDFRA